jgi:hypothetical protein
MVNMAARCKLQAASRAEGGKSKAKSRKAKVKAEISGESKPVLISTIANYSPLTIHH